MKKEKIMKWALPALLMSAITFELMPGSVHYNIISLPKVGYHFFNLQMGYMSASCLTLAGYATFLALVLALVAAFSKKHPIFKAVSWCSLIAASLTAAPYMIPAEEMVLQPNVIITILLTACWLIAFLLDKEKGTEEKPADRNTRL